jgi:hypothetical protein
MTIESAALAACQARAEWLDCWCTSDGHIDCEHYVAFSRAMDLLAEAVGLENPSREFEIGGGG